MDRQQQSKPPSARGAPRFWSVQVLRIIAAYGVVLSHFLMSHDGGHSLMNGVDIFFLISGFLVWVISDRLTVTPVYFMAHRLVRIVPMYWVVVAAQCLLVALLPGTFADVDASPGNVGLTLLFLPHMDQFGRMWPFITQGWTLNLDIFYYAVFAVALAFPRRWRLLVVSASLVALTLIGVAVRPWHNGVVTWTYTNPLAIAFVAGLWIAEWWLQGRLRSRALGVVLMAACAVIYAHQLMAGTAYAGLDVLVWVAASTCGLIGLLCLEGSGVTLELPWMRTLADWTYAVYLSHQLVRMMAERWLPSAEWVQFVALVGGATLAGKLGYEWVELPINRWFRRLEARHASHVRGTADAPISSTAQLKDVAP